MRRSQRRAGTNILNLIDTMKPVFHLVHVGRDCFIMRNPYDKLTNRMCNSTIFDVKEDANKDISVFEYFGVELSVFGRLDRRTTRAKLLIKKYGYFSAGYLPEISKRAKNNKYTNIRGSYHENRI